MHPRPRSTFHGVFGDEMTLAAAAAIVGMTGERLLSTIDALDSLGSVSVRREFPRVVGIQLAGRTRLFAAMGAEAQAHLLGQEVVRHLDGPWFYGDREAVR